MQPDIHPPDGAMLYTETNLHHLFPEPWNMVISMFFLIPGIYWLMRLKGFSRHYSFLSVAVWLMLVGDTITMAFAGGTYLFYRLASHCLALLNGQCQRLVFSV